MINNKGYEFLLVFLQFSLIFFLFALYLNFYGLNFNLWRLGLLSVGVFIGLWALLVMHRDSLISIFPSPKKGAFLVEEHLPYKYIRHPMYLSVLVVSASFVFDLFSLIIWILLLAVLLSKMSYEEKALKKKFKRYSEYMKKTKRLIPKIY